MHIYPRTNIAMEKLENNILQLISAVADTPGTLETREQDADRAIQRAVTR